MRFKLDENLGRQVQQLFRDAGHEVETVWDEGLQGSSDQTIYNTCYAENRCLVTFDLDFSNVIRFPPGKTGGIVIFRLPQNPKLSLLENLVRQFLRKIKQLPVDKQLWIVEPARIRIHERPDD
ncbi:MAG: DUF5615 family PIN-like protein [Bacillota bacterium]